MPQTPSGTCAMLTGLRLHPTLVHLERFMLVCLEFRCDRPSRPLVIFTNHQIIDQDTEKSKVLQSIASVIQAMPPEEEITPIEVILLITLWDLSADPRFRPL